MVVFTFRRAFINSRSLIGSTRAVRSMSPLPLTLTAAGLHTGCFGSRDRLRVSTLLFDNQSFFLFFSFFFPSYIYIYMLYTLPYSRPCRTTADIWVPQVGDRVVYYPQGHRESVQRVLKKQGFTAEERNVVSVLKHQPAWIKSKHAPHAGEDEKESESESVCTRHFSHLGSSSPNWCFYILEIFCKQRSLMLAS